MNKQKEENPRLYIFLLSKIVNNTFLYLLGRPSDVFFFLKVHLIYVSLKTKNNLK